MKIKRKIINITAGLIGDIKISEYLKDGRKQNVINFVLSKKYGKSKEYIHCTLYNKLELADNFKMGDNIHVTGFYKTKTKNDKSYMNFIVIDCNKV